MEKICIYDIKLYENKEISEYLNSVYSCICTNKLGGKKYITVYHGNNNIFVKNNKIDVSLEKKLNVYLLTDWKINNTEPH